MKRNAFGRNGKERQELATPRWLAEEIRKRSLRMFLGNPIRFDVCAHEQNAVCPEFFTEQDNGLAKPWPWYPCFCNPPFSLTAAWLAKGLNEHWKGNCDCQVFLLRGGDLQTGWVHRYQRFFLKEMITPRVNYWNWREDKIERGVGFPSMLWWLRPGIAQRGDRFVMRWWEVRPPKG